VLIRPATEADLDRILAYPVTEPAGQVTAGRYREGLARHHYRPEWTWIAEDAGRIVARAIWWGFAAAAYPLALDCVDAVPFTAVPFTAVPFTAVPFTAVPFTAGASTTGASTTGRTALAADLIAAGQQALRRPDSPATAGYEINLPSGWRSDPAVAAAFGWRRDAAARAGLTDELERIRFEWTPGAGLPRPGGRLVYRPEPDDDRFADVFRQIAAGSLDVTTRREVALLGAARQARADMEIYLAMPGDRDWWRLAYTAADGQLAGMILPNHSTDGGAVVGYLGVVPGLRGHGYIADLVAETTRFHAGRGEPRIAATTDTTNRPMAAAFERAGYRARGIKYVLSAPAG
jgi:RimJ/RimL family protein N-acetyltransferase